MNMNREILFRGKRIKNGEWIEGYYRYIPCINRHSILPTNPKNEQEEYPIILETVGQYTGLTDKNGKKIFEGDIVRCSSGIYGEVKFGLYPAAFSFSDKNQGFYVEFPEDSLYRKELGYWRNAVVVVGNIYDNPELLEDKENKHGEDI